MLTKGIDHIGLTVNDLSASFDFFVNCLDWEKKGEKPEYPAVFVSDGHCLLTLWERKSDGPQIDFNRHENTGLHHLALKVPDEASLFELFDKVKDWKNVFVEFAPEYSGKGPKKHFMVNEPGGNRIEFSWDPR